MRTGREARPEGRCYTAAPRPATGAREELTTHDTDPLLADGMTLEVTRVVRPSGLAEADLDHWRALQRASPELDRAFFAPEWFRLLESAGHAVDIVVLGSGHDELAYFPMHVENGIARPPGGRLADFQGWIGAAGLPVEIAAVLRAAGARAWYFDHLLAGQQAAAHHATELAPSPVADLGRGFDAFVAAHRAEGAGWASQVPRKARKLGREVGPLRFELSTAADASPAVLDRLRSWKGAQRERTQTIDPLDEPWAERTVSASLATDGPGFAGVLSALYAGDELVAAHLGLRTATTLHVWFPAYDTDREAYSPGMVLFLELLRAAADDGVQRIDFGKGPARYKTSLMTSSEAVAEGYVDLRPLGRLMSGATYAGRRWMRSSGAAALVRGPKRRLRKLFARRDAR